MRILYFFSELKECILKSYLRRRCIFSSKNINVIDVLWVENSTNIMGDNPFILVKCMVEKKSNDNFIVQTGAFIQRDKISEID